MRGLLLLLASVAACTVSRSEVDLERYLARGKVGSSPDVGLYKLSELRGEWDHVATVHGMADDASLCETIASQLRQGFPREQWSCRPLNE